VPTGNNPQFDARLFSPFSKFSLMSMQDQIRKEIEQSSLDDTIRRVETLLAETESPRPLHLGILLALRIGKELREGKAPGTDTEGLVAQWTASHSNEVIDEAITFARHFLLKPQELMTQIVTKLDTTHDTANDEAEEAELSDRIHSQESDEE